jgi:hypothetical protein
MSKRKKDTSVKQADDSATVPEAVADEAIPQQADESGADETSASTREEVEAAAQTDEAPEPGMRCVELLTNVKHDGKRFPLGAIATLPTEIADRLIAASEAREP